ncbi:MAG: short-chain dehydrogenase [Comamonadaceae bacterium CG1_02_60_18]|nr:MAG: short-chain dehydrogenase [Comamonadaceae bacterium CG1_02_60_18]PIQ51413.1 MAG: short-chain dehydrogenase [Comamonadaceae bacterium CG12_big_fil_rev_8_21_14_0_65_59_15]
MTQHLCIITGASRGLGLSLAEQLLLPKHQLLCISRQHSTALADAARLKHVPLTQWQADLADAAPVAARLQQWLSEQNLGVLASVTLINNAGVISAIKPLRANTAAQLTLALRVGLEAPMLLTAAFLAATQQCQALRRVLNISSGLGRRAMASQASYCAAKAGMDHFTRCLALDEAHVPNGARVCSLAPGVIDTPMQLQLRDADPNDFPDQAGFAHLKESGQLSTAHDTAARVLAYLNRPDFGSEPVADVRR